VARGKFNSQIINIANDYGITLMDGCLFNRIYSRQYVLSHTVPIGKV
jgi:hypothetical protein